MRNAIIVVACLISTSAFAIDTQRGGQPGSSPRIADTVRMAQSACWYAVYFCSRNQGEASRWARDRRHPGSVLNTSSDEFPNFAPGYYCVADGPMGQRAAQNAAARARNVAPTSYAKSAC
jgi:hypothetical protein